MTTTPRLKVETGFDPAKVEASIRELLEAVALCSMATVSEDGSAHCNTAFFCKADLWRMFFVSHFRSRHVQNLEARPSMAWTVFDSTQQWGTALRGVQIAGRAKPAGLVDGTLGVTQYGARFPGFAASVLQTPVQQVLSGEYKFYVFEPSEFKLFDEPTFGEETYIRAEVIRT